MRRHFDWLMGGLNGQRGVRFWLQTAGAALALLNGIALFLYLDPPGGSREQLAAESAGVRRSITAERGRSVRLKNIAAKVQVGGSQSSEFESHFFLPKRTAYSMVISEIQRMASASGMKERDSVFTEEPIEGSSDLDLLNVTGNYEGSYDSLMKFLHEVDRSPMFLMLDTLQAAPQQRTGLINASIRFQAVLHDETATAPATLGGQP